jgi:hypothetical protein
LELAGFKLLAEAAEIHLIVQRVARHTMPGVRVHESGD